MRYFNVPKTNEKPPKSLTNPEVVQIALASRIRRRPFISKGHAINLRVGVKAMT